MSAIFSLIPTILGMFGGGGGSSSSDQQASTDAAAAQAKKDAELQQQREAATKAQMLKKSAPDAQAATGGSLTEAPFAALTSNIAGIPGDVTEALRLLGSRDSGESSGVAVSGGF